MTGTDGWTRATLGEVAHWSSGGTPKAGTAAYYGGDIRWAVIGDLNDGLVSRTAATITEAGLASSSAKVVPAGTVLVAMYGSIGKLGIAAVDMATNQAIACAQVRPELLLPEYLFWYLRGQRSRLKATGKGATQSNISQTILKSWPISFPDLPRQRRLVEEVERRLSRVTAGQQYLSKARRNVAAAREGVLLRATTGQLTQPSAVEPNVAEHLAAALEGRVPARVHLDDLTDLPDIPGHWMWVRLGDIAEIVGGVTKDSKRQGSHDYIEVPYLRVANVQRGYLDLSQVASIRVPEAKARSLELAAGDVLFNEGGDRDKLGRGWVWEGQIAACIHQNHVFRARLVPGTLLPRLLSWYGNSVARHWFEVRGKQTTNLASLNLTTLKSLPVPVPPLPEQLRIQTLIEQRLSLLSRADQDAAQSERKAQVLEEAIIANAFRSASSAQKRTETETAA